VPSSPRPLPAAVFVSGECFAFHSLADHHFDMRLLIIANTDKPKVASALKEMLPWIEKRVQVIGVDTQINDEKHRMDADAILVLGGDGTLLSAVRRLGGRQIPLLGVNFGRLGFLAGFTPRQFQHHFENFATNKLPISKRQMLQVAVAAPEGGDPDRFLATALNDAVITAGPPFHMIELQISAATPDGEENPSEGVSYFGDGVIVATASGSTAYNVSAGGPIISPTVEAICITPMCAHTLTFRPVVISSASVVRITAVRVNEGTTLFCDGQESTRLSAGETVVIQKNPDPVLLVENPDVGEWRNLAEKLNWAAGPGYNSAK
jgi:NAD+ kinase